MIEEMTLLDTLLLSIVEGITEFLPISSTGHLVLTAHLLGLEQTEFLKSFEIVIQLGAILAVVALYWRILLKGPTVWTRILTAFLPTAIIGLLLYKLIKSFLIGNVYVVLFALFFGGILLILLERIHKEEKTHHETIESIPLKKAFLIGLCQSVSVVPGVSRSAASIIGGLFVGIKRETAVTFSFLLAIPTMIAATGLDLFETKLQFTSQELLFLSVGFVGSFLVAILAIKLFLQYVKSHSFVAFGVYRIILAALYWIFIIL